MIVDDSQWSTYLESRDTLKADGMLGARYGELKKTLHVQFAQDRCAHTKARDDFIHGMLSR